MNGWSILYTAGENLREMEKHPRRTTYYLSSSCHALTAGHLGPFKIVLHLYRSLAEAVAAPNDCYPISFPSFSLYTLQRIKIKVLRGAGDLHSSSRSFVIHPVFYLPSGAQVSSVQCVQSISICQMYCSSNMST